MTVLQDLRHAFRALLRHPGATLVSLGVLSLGIGAAMALFSLYHALVLRPPAVLEPERLVQVQVAHPNGVVRDLCPLDVADLRRAPGRLLEPFRFGSVPMRVQGPGVSRTVLAVFVSEGYFACLRPRFVWGAPFGPGVREGAVLSEDLFERCFGKGAALAGREIRLAGVSVPVVGVVERAFRGLEPGLVEDLWVPQDLAERVDPPAFKAAQARWDSGGGTDSYARLPRGVTSAQAEASLGGVAAEWAQAMPATHAGVRLRVQPAGQPARRLWERYLPQRRLLFAAVGLLGLLGALNVVQLQVARWLASRRELAGRMALGATRGRLLRELGAELGLLILGAGALALPTGFALAAGLERLQPPSEFPLRLDLTPGWPVFGFALVLLALLALLMGGLAFLWLSRDRSAEVLRSGAGPLGGAALARRTLLGFQLALALGLLGTALPVFLNLRAARRLDLGFRPQGVYAVSFAPPWFLGKGAAFRALWIRLIDRLRSQGEVSGCMVPPLEAFEVEGQAAAEDGRPCVALRNFVQPGFLELLGVPLLEGRALDERDGEGAPLVAVVDQTLARALWPGRSALGQTLLRDGGRRLTVVGVCAPFRLQDPLRPPRPFYLQSQRQSGHVLFSLLVRSHRSEADRRAWLEREAEAVEPRLALLRAEPLTDRLDRHLQPLRLGTALLGALSGLALVLAAAGTYGLQSLLAAQRRPEQALRAALGATPARLVREALLGTLLPTLAGLGGGFALAWALRRVLTGLLGPLGRVELASLLLAGFALLLTALLASLLPALRAARVHPAEAIRSE